MKKKTIGKTNYLDFFRQYFYNEHNDFKVKDHIISFSKKTVTKTFNSLIKKIMVSGKKSNMFVLNKY